MLIAIVKPKSNSQVPDPVKSSPSPNSPEMELDWALYYNPEGPPPTFYNFIKAWSKVRTSPTRAQIDSHLTQKLDHIDSMSSIKISDRNPNFQHFFLIKTHIFLPIFGNILRPTLTGRMKGMARAQAAGRT